MTSFDHITIPTCGNWFQTNPLEHELDDRAGNTEFSVSMVTHTENSVCVTNGKDIALQRQIWSTFVTVLWFRKTEIQNRIGVLVLVRVLWVTTHFLIEITWGVQFVWYQCQWKRDVAYIMTYHCISVFTTYSIEPKTSIGRGSVLLGGWNYVIV